ncbi:hypothetical protein AAFF_G00344630 [Aldrovandia affinis]|uniref:Uncharacterized protein n=1 Tax=Aldrovandia affinis TaxID=143900 RepID=A0AAD7WPE1_9TELE|nr:hypothetical protein AAFF_G00344630 [Aldrovandia affinis]
MKAALRASLKDDSWCDRLLWVLQGIRTAPKEDLQLELVYGQPLSVPGDFMPNASVPWSASVQRSAHLSRAEVFVPVPTSWHGLPQSQGSNEHGSRESLAPLTLGLRNAASASTPTDRSSLQPAIYLTHLSFGGAKSKTQTQIPPDLEMTDPPRHLTAGPCPPFYHSHAEPDTLPHAPSPSYSICSRCWGA